MNDPDIAIPCSPVTRGKRVSLCDEIPTSSIVSAYYAIGVDVRGFFSDLDTVKVYLCADTGYRFYSPSSLAAGPEFYALLQKSMPYYAEWRSEHEYAARLLDQPGKVLEIGCGTGNFLQRIATGYHQQVVGLELNTEAQLSAVGRGLDVHAKAVEDFVADHKEEFDTVCSFHVLEHVTDVASFLESACQALKPGARLILAVPNNNPYVYKHDRLHALNLPPHHMGLWDRPSLSAITRVLPLDVLNVHVVPLEEPGFYYTLYLKHLQTYKPSLHKLLSRLPWKITRLLIAAIGRFAEGSNLVAVYRKHSG